MVSATTDVHVGASERSREGGFFNVTRQSSRNMPILVRLAY